MLTKRDTSDHGRSELDRLSGYLALNDVFVAGLPSLAPVNQQWSRSLR